MDKNVDVAVIGGGIVGLAHAYMVLRKGLSVVLFDREEYAIGASVRNFGLLWPIGQEPGVNLDRALRSRHHWDEVAESAGIWLNPNGSLQLAYHGDEQAVLEEFLKLYSESDYQCKLLNAKEVAKISSSTKTDYLRCGLWSKTEATVNPREAIRKIPYWLEEQYNLELRFGTLVRSIEFPFIHTETGKWKVQKVFVCPGADFQTLYPNVYTKDIITKCKLQMMKASVKSNPQLGPTLCAGLTLRHYPAFSKCSSLQKVSERYNFTSPYFEKFGIHVLLAQNNNEEFIIGDSHEYGQSPQPFDTEEINQHILNYLSSFWKFDNIKITERWNGIYPKTKDGKILIQRPEKDVVLVNGLGGAGMTLSFGLAEEIINQEL